MSINKTESATVSTSVFADCYIKFYAETAILPAA